VNVFPLENTARHAIVQIVTIYHLLKVSAKKSSKVYWKEIQKLLALKSIEVFRSKNENIIYQGAIARNQAV